MNEKEWVSEVVVDMLQSYLCSSETTLIVWKGKKLPYASEIRAYAAEKGPDADAPTTLAQLGFASGDLTGTHFSDSDFSYTVSDMDPLTYTITVSAPAGITTPSQITLAQDGTWTETQ